MACLFFASLVHWISSANSACKIVFGHLKVQYIDSAKLKSRATDCNNNDNNNNNNNNNNNDDDDDDNSRNNNKL